MSRNHPGRSRNDREWSQRVLEGFRSFRKVPQVFGQYHMRPTTLILGGQGTPRGLDEIRWWGRPTWGGVLLGLRLPGGRSPFGRRSPRGTPPPLIAPQGASWPPIK